MEIRLTGKAEQIVKGHVASGVDAGAFVADAVIRYGTYCKKKMEILNREIAVGIEQADKGECVQADFDSIMLEIDRELGYHNT